MSEDRGKRRTRRLTEEERALWDHAARSMTPLGRAKSRIHPSAAEPDAAQIGAAAGPAGERRAKRGEPAPTAIPPAKPQRPPVVLPSYSPPVSTSSRTGKRAVPDLTGFDDKSARRLRGGRIEIGARIDLHGMRQDEARSALAGFLRSAQARGHRYVLVITGKGAQRRSSASENEPWSPDRPDPPGVLRRNVPVWLASPEMRSLVVSYTEAGIQHGGTGALYVQVRVRG